MLSQILRIASGFVDDVNDAVIGGGPAGPLGTSKVSGQLGMEVELMTPQIRLKNIAVPVAAGKFQYVQLAAGSAVPAVGSTVNWDATANKNQYRVTASAGTAAGTALTTSVTPGNYTLIQTSVAVPTGTAVMEPRGLGEEGEGDGGPLLLRDAKDSEEKTGRDKDNEEKPNQKPVSRTPTAGRG